MGDRFILCSQRAKEIIEELLDPSNMYVGKSFIGGLFNGEYCQKEAGRLTTMFSEMNCDAIVACGGGKVIDAGKAMADLSGSL